MKRLLTALPLMLLLLASCGGSGKDLTAPPPPSSSQSEGDLAETEAPKDKTGFFSGDMQLVAEQYGGDFLAGLTWCSDSELLIELIKNQDGPTNTIWVLANVDTGETKCVYNRQTDQFDLISDCLWKDGLFIATFMNGDMLKFKDWELVEEIRSGEHELSSIRDIHTGDLYFFNGTHIVRKSGGSDGQEEPIYQLNTSYDSEEAMYPRSLALSEDGKTLAFAAIWGEFSSKKTVIVNTQDGTSREIESVMQMPDYFWIGDSLFNVENVDYNVGGRTDFRTGENFEKVISREYEGDGYCTGNQGKKYGCVGNRVPLIFTMRNNSELALFYQDMKLETVYTADDRFISEPVISPGGKRLAFYEMQMGVKFGKVKVLDI